MYDPGTTKKTRLKVKATGLLLARMGLGSYWSAEAAGACATQGPMFSDKNKGYRNKGGRNKFGKSRADSANFAQIWQTQWV